MFVYGKAANVVVYALMLCGNIAYTVVKVFEPKYVREEIAEDTENFNGHRSRKRFSKYVSVSLACIANGKNSSTLVCAMPRSHQIGYNHT